MNGSWATTLLIAAILLIGGVAPSLAADARSIQRFNQVQSRWDDLVGVTLKLEGRYSSVLNQTIRFRNCELPFHSEKPLPPLAGSSQTLEVTGRLVKEHGKLFFAVETVRERASDVALLRQKQAQLDRKAPPERWYELARWAENRSRFYQDPELHEAAQQLFLKGIAIETHNAPATDPKAFFRLAEKVADFGLPASVQQEYKHQGYHLEWKAAQKNPQVDLEELAERIAGDLADCKVPLSLPQPKLAQRYWADPWEVYRTADEAVRSKLHRIFYREVERERICRQAAEDGSNGLDIATMIDRQLPEMFELAEEYRSRALAFQLANVATLTRAEAVELSERFRRRRKPRLARQTLKDWLHARRQRLQADDVDAVLKLSREYVNLLEDKQTATQLLFDAYERYPDVEAISQRLNQYGYFRRNGRWLTQAQLDAQPEDPIQQAMREGRITLGMTPAQVRKTLGAPNATARAASAGQISQVWIYGNRGGSRIVIHFQRRGRQRQAEVVGVTETNGVAQGRL